MLAKTLCSERLSRQGAALFFGGIELPPSACCPISRVPYEISSLGLSCWDHHMTFLRSDLHVGNDPPELYA
ncbi:hypothetical protein IJT93_01540 [bacterium]|nr:hypothetical protein [bacterium]